MKKKKKLPKIFTNIRVKNKTFFYLLLLSVFAFLGTFLLVTQRQNLSQQAAGALTETVTVNLSQPTTVSRFSSGLSQVDTSLRYPWSNNDQTAVNNAKTLIHNGI